MIVYKITRSDFKSFCIGLPDRYKLTYKKGETVKPKKGAIYTFDSIANAKIFVSSQAGFHYIKSELRLFKCEGKKSRGKIKYLPVQQHLLDYFRGKRVPIHFWFYDPPKGTVLMKEVKILEEIELLPGKEINHG